VNAPFSWPNSSDAISEGGMAAQLTRMKARLARFDRLWIARAIALAGAGLAEDEHRGVRAGHRTT